VSGQAAIGYGYETANKDRLISYNGETIGEYDAQGNPWKYRGKTLSWAKRGELTQFGSSYYAYNANGVRTSKNGIKYFYDGHRLIKEEHTDYSLWFFYDERGIAGFTKSGNANSVTSSDTSYYYRKNAEGDITHLYSQGGDLLARYEYNAWGEVRVYNRNGSDITEGSNYANEIGRINPIRYRGYYYDEDTKLYYLINRYYDPEVGRFINADDIKYLDPETLGGINLFAYCNNNPVMGFDPEGHVNWWKFAAIVLAAVVIVAATVATVATFGATSVAGTIAITSAVTVAAKTVEVGTLQYKKSVQDGDEGGEIFTDVVDSIFGNGNNIIGWTPVTKTGGYAIGVFSETNTFQECFELMKIDGFSFKNFMGITFSSVKERFLYAKEYLGMPTGKLGYAVSYGMAGINVASAIMAFIVKDPIAYANWRGYKLV